jgi:hypothetical protein
MVVNVSFLLFQLLFLELGNKRALHTTNLQRFAVKVNSVFPVFCPGVFPQNIQEKSYCFCCQILRLAIAR